ncbi:hypothetical protein O181_052060 [Austropuccinia psidii MF-1]|uniref:Uncharacterized protein n=1 Tax=Austropuccinia psidii MF-1 TaxID=1389203 RepID=A0A9Q3E469_9BASI|nr:hypothetical protein [Austropuccinia psidii MF-1]
MYGGMPPYACPGSLVLSRIPTRHRQVLTPVQDPNGLHAKPCTVNPYARAAFQKCQQFLMPVQAPNNSNNFLRQGSLATAPTLPYVGAGTQRFTPKSLRLCRFPKIQKIAYARVGF